MRIVAWNCAGGFHAKAAALAALAPDLAVVAECGDPAALVAKAPGFAPVGAVWAGAAGKKGLAVFAFGRFAARLDESWDERITYALPVRVEGPNCLNLLALWAHHGKRLPRMD